VGGVENGSGVDPGVSGGLVVFVCGEVFDLICGNACQDGVTVGGLAIEIGGVVVHHGAVSPEADLVFAIKAWGHDFNMWHGVDVR